MVLSIKVQADRIFFLCKEECQVFLSVTFMLRCSFISSFFPLTPSLIFPGCHGLKMSRNVIHMETGVSEQMVKKLMLGNI